MKKIIAISLFMIITLGCEEKTPEGIVPEDQMVNLLIDMHITDAEVSILHLPNDSTKILASKLEGDVLKKYKITKKTYTDSYNYYLNNVNKMDEIYQAVVDSLSLRERLKKID